MSNNKSDNIDYEGYLKWKTSQEEKPSTRKPADGKTGGGKRNQGSWGQKKPNRGGSMPKTNVYSNVRKDEMPSSLPTPGSHLSKTASELKNDPLYQEAYFPDPSEEFRAVADEQKIYSGCESFMAVSDATFTELCAHDPSYKKTIPQSLHTYYIGMLTYARMLQLHNKSGGDLTHDEAQFVDQVVEGRGQDSGYTMPKVVQLYLSGFGDTTLPGGRDVKFGFQKPTLTRERVNTVHRDVVVPGFFGSIAENMGHYATKPCPGVLMQRVLQDLIVSRDHQRPPGRWDLPNGIAYQDRAINRNCIGYAPSVRLRPEALQAFDDAGFEVDDPHFNNREVPFNIPLMNQVLAKLRTIRNLTLFPFPETRVGSVGQLLYQEIVENLNQHVVSSTFIARSTLKVPGAVGRLGSTFLYQLKRNENEQSGVMPVNYDDDDDIPPEEWDAMVWNFEHSDPTLHYRRYEVVCYDVALRLKEMVKKDFTTM